MQRIIFFVFTLFLAAIGAHTPIAAQGIDDDIDLDALYEQIDEALENSPRYVAEREKKIEEVRNTFSQNKTWRNDSKPPQICSTCTNLIRTTLPSIMPRWPSILPTLSDVPTSPAYTVRWRQTCVLEQICLQRHWNNCD